MKTNGCILVLLASMPLHAETEPNNEAAKANAVKIGEEVAFKFEEQGDRDYFSLKAPAAGVLSFRVTQSSEAHSPHPWWGEYEEDGKSYVLRDGTWGRHVEKDETVVFAIRSHSYTHGEKASPDVLKGVFELTPPVDPEPNDTPENAVARKIGEEFAFSLNPQYDRDTFRVESPGNGVVRFELTKGSDAHDPFPWWGVYEGEDGREYERRSGQWDIAAKNGESLVFQIRSHPYSHGESASPDVLKGRFVFESAVGSEPNDDSASATPVKLGEEISFQINPRLDRDYFTIPSPGRGSLRFRLTQTSPGHSPYPWWGEFEGEDGRKYERRPGQWDIETKAGETLVFAIRSHPYSHGETGSADVLKGIFEFIPAVGAEPNDTAAQATPAEIGKPVVFQLTPRLDRDYFSVLSPGRGTIRFNITGKPATTHTLHPWWGEADGEDGAKYEFRSGYWDRATEPGETAIFAVRSHPYNHGETAIDEPITGVFEFIPDSGGEPNDTPGQARDTAIDETFQCVLMPLGDQDCFRFTAPGPGVFRLESLDEKKVHPGLFPIWIHGDDAYASHWETRATSQGEQAVLAIRSDRYHFNYQASEEPVSLAVRFIPEPDAPENGDEATDVTEAEIGKPFNFALIPTYDRDHFRFTPAKDGYVALRLQTAPATGHRVIHAWRETDAGESVEAAAFQVQAGKSYTLGLATDRSNWSSEDILTAVIEFTDPPPENDKKSRRWTFGIERTAP